MAESLLKIRAQKAYQEFEFASLRHVVSTAEKFGCVIREIREKAGFSRHLLMQTEPEKMTYERLRSRYMGFSP